MGDCACAEHENVWHGRIANLALSRVSKQVSKEFLKCLYNQYMVHFSCLCELGRSLNNNKMLFANLRGIKVHWNGPVAGKSFLKMATMPQLKRLILVVSKATTANLSERQEGMNRYFRQQSRQPRLSDALGMDELLEIRGLDQVDVMHIMAKQGFRRTDEEKANLQHLLRDKLTQERLVRIFYVVTSPVC